MPVNIIAKGANAIVEWFEENTTDDFLFSTDGQNLIINSDIQPFLLEEASNEDIQLFGVAACLGALGTAFVMGVLPIAKISKIKNALNAVGGKTKFVTNLIKHYNFNKDKGWSVSKSYDEAFDRPQKRLDQK